MLLCAFKTRPMCTLEFLYIPKLFPILTKGKKANLENLEEEKFSFLNHWSYCKHRTGYKILVYGVIKSYLVEYIMDIQEG